MMAIKEQAKAQGFVETLLGRKRQIPELRASNPALRGAGERMAINMPIQGTAADILKIAMIRVDERIRAAGLRARLLLSVHDELLFEVPRDEVEPLARARARDDGGRAAARRAARRRRQGRRRLGIDDAADPRRRDRRRGRTRRPDRGAARAARRVGPPMPELPEVETVARDLRPRIVGATIVGARSLVGADAADARARGVRGRRSPAGASRRSAGGPSRSSSSCRATPR